MAVRPIDGNVLIEWFRPYLHTGEAIPADVVINDIRSMPTLTPLNEPLTLDDLREMDGEPVFVVIDDGIEPLRMWALVDYIAEEQCLTLTNNLGGRSQYYTADDLELDHITVYRRPPEREEDSNV